MVCPKSNVSDFIVKQLYVGAQSDRLGSVKGEVGSRTSGRSIVSEHPGSKERSFRKLFFVSHASRNASHVENKGWPSSFLWISANLLWKLYLLARALKYVLDVIRTIFFVRCIPKISRVGVVLRAESWFSRTSVVKFQVCYHFTALVRENQLPPSKITSRRLTFGVWRRKKFLIMNSIFVRTFFYYFEPSFYKWCDSNKSRTIF